MKKETKQFEPVVIINGKDKVTDKLVKATKGVAEANELIKAFNDANKDKIGSLKHEEIKALASDQIPDSIYNRLYVGFPTSVRQESRNELAPALSEFKRKLRSALDSNSINYQLPAHFYHRDCIELNKVTYILRKDITEYLDNQFNTVIRTQKALDLYNKALEAKKAIEEVANELSVSNFFHIFSLDKDEGLEINGIYFDENKHKI